MEGILFLWFFVMVCGIVFWVVYNVIVAEDKMKQYENTPEYREDRIMN